MIAFKDSVAQGVAAADDWIGEQEVAVRCVPGLSQFVRVWYQAE